MRRPVGRRAAERALPGLVGPLVAEGLLESGGDEIRARVDLRPYGDDDHDWWVVCDPTPALDQRHEPPTPDHVLGISEASSSLARLTVRRPLGRALDLGTGCGVQSLHLATHSDTVVGTDVNPRAVWLAGLTAALNEVTLDLRTGTLWEPVAGERFDLVTSNPPFVVSPPDGDRLVYRESALPGDEIVRRLVTGAATRLREDGWCQLLASWIHSDGQPWEERLGSWLEGTGLDAWIVQREVADVAAYAEMWLADAGLRAAPDYVDRYDRWLGWLAAHGIEAMGFGWISLHRTDRDEAHRRLEEWTHEIEGPIGPDVLAWAATTDLLATDDDAALLDRRWRQADGLTQETYAVPGAADPHAVVLRRAHGLRRARRVDVVEAGLVGACDGELTAAQILGGLAVLLDRETTDLTTGYAASVRSLAAEGYLVPA